MDPVTLELIRRGGQIALSLYREGRKSRLFKYLKSGCLLLSVFWFLVLAFFVAGIPTMLGVYVVPAAELSQLENIPEGMHDANLHYKGEGGPLPRDIVLTPALEEFARQTGLYVESALDPYYQVRGCIAGADYMGVAREQLCAVMLLEGGWPSEIESRTFVTAVSVARGLLKLKYDPSDTEIKWVVVDATGVRCEEEGFECVEPVHRECDNATCKAFLSYFGTETLVDLLDTLSGPWQIANTAEVKDYKGEWPVGRYWLYVNLGLDDAFILGSTGGEGVQYVDGIPVILEPGIPPPNELPDFPDGFLVHPVPGGYVSGYRFRSGHPGTDFSRRPTGWAVAVCNGEVTFIGWDPDGYGNYVKLSCPLPDGGATCSLYGHGKTRTPREVDDKLKAGAAILEIGSTGDSTGPHLHFEIWPECTYHADPEKILPPQ